MQCFEYFLIGGQRVLIYCGDGRVWVKLGTEDGGRHFGEFIEEERDNFEDEDLKYFSRMFRILSDCEAVTVVEAAKDEPVKVEKAYELFSNDAKEEQSNHLHISEKEAEKVVFKEDKSRPATVVLHVSKFSEFTCSICDKTYSTKPKLKKHMDRRHKNEKSGCYQCDKCPKNFTERCKLKSHAADHEVKKKVNCN